MHEGDFLGVVAEREWDAIRAARQLEVTWSEVEPPFPEMDELYSYIRRRLSSVRAREEARAPDFAPDKAPLSPLWGRRIGSSKRSRIPVPVHGCMAPACAVCDYRGDSATLWPGFPQKPHYAAEGVAKFLGTSLENVRGIWVLGPG
ncbi:MAG: hypothetical protein CM1200mP36_10180 [Gammaproteobacteria bacterium]|nr:MAG: hypothetical protein CM1200mP36_10180 [Gammaproteobacteria bacterium]